MNGIPEKVKRGFLDVTIRINPGFDLRMVGVHLKSKLTADGSEALMRRHEAAQLRRHIDEIMVSEPSAKLLVYGDFNDTRSQPAMQEIMGTRGSPTFLTDLQARDSVGDKWTQYWRAEDLYSRIDYFLANSALFRVVAPKKTYVYRSDYWNDASDHRPIYTTIIPTSLKP
jgi:endonuclease/exonuclease/phosphatase family metal-dependent hydrolase